MFSAGESPSTSRPPPPTLALPAAPPAQPTALAPPPACAAREAKPLWLATGQEYGADGDLGQEEWPVEAELGVASACSGSAPGRRIGAAKGGGGAPRARFWSAYAAAAALRGQQGEAQGEDGRGEQQRTVREGEGSGREHLGRWTHTRRCSIASATACSPRA
ncbi:unnamed protein product [Urochloa humidicola]